MCPARDCLVPFAADFPKMSRDGWKAYLPYEFRAPSWNEAGSRLANLTEVKRQIYIRELEERDAVEG